jgi:putative flippase GtrA
LAFSKLLLLIKYSHIYLNQLFGAEVLRFSIVGLMSNAALYLLYLLCTGVGFGHKTAMTILFVIGTIQTFTLNKNWTFQYQGFNKSILAKYMLIYSGAYITNLLGLMFFVDYLHLPDEIVQGVMIFLVAVLLFLLQRYWVFRKLNATIILD